MEMFNAHRRDLLGFEDYMDLKKPGFGGPKSAIPSRDAKGKLIDKNPKLAQHRRVVERDPAFSHKVWDSTYKAMTHDLVYKQEGKKPFTYPDPYLTAYPTVEVGEIDENTKVVSFSQFINENIEPEEEWAPDENPEEAWMPEDNPGDIYPEGKDETDYPNPVYDDGRPLMSDDIKNIQARLRKYERGGSQDEEFGLNPNDPSNPLGLSKEEMDAFLKDLNA